MRKMMSEADSGLAACVAAARERRPQRCDGSRTATRSEQLGAIKGLVWRRGDEIVVNPDRPFIRNLDDLPMPLHHLLPLDKYRIPMVKGPYTFIVTSRGCTAGCKYCIKHVSYQYSIRLRSPESIMQELWELNRLGIHNFTCTPTCSPSTAIRWWACAT